MKRPFFKGIHHDPNLDEDFSFADIDHDELLSFEELSKMAVLKAERYGFVYKSKEPDSATDHN
eukprot:CAMPEP_0116886856 /NCGR_PEP_ID=MMETSP0463-20121206/20828_1 /TAXON_ID=181622 /ORGANISM="Strombidinopsis sp, Strain SopsisLIS2011" /LENGTH=62 /DNA_ID=CAMNT_0004547939 /DNA_START=1103 /DNA_END=1291 /DNA_ORIENTATION=-